MEIADIRIAVLIDADNVPYKNISGILEEVAHYGTPTIKRIYGDWAKPNLKGWEQIMLENAITPIQQYRYTIGKNATDSAMIIDAMDILYQDNVEGFCLVSSDSDFTRLATRLREQGKWVLGIGEQKTPKPFIVACNKFVYIEIIADNGKEEIVKKSIQSIPKDEYIDLMRLINTAIDASADDTGYAFLADVGNTILKMRPDFDTRKYGYYKLSNLIKDLGQFTIDERKIANSNIRHVYIKNINEK